MLVQGSPTEMNTSYPSFIEDARSARHFFSQARPLNESTDRKTAPAETRAEETREAAAPKKARWSFGSVILGSCPEYFEAFA